MHLEAAIFDMDGVITNTAAVHYRAWKSTFDAYLEQVAAKGGRPFREFTHDDYLAFVDGRPRYDGVRTFLKSRGFELPQGHPGEAPNDKSLCGLGNRKDEGFNRILAAEGVEIFDSTIALIQALRAAGVRVGVATSSKNSAIVLDKARIAGLFQASVDGRLAAELGLKGKPAPDIFVLACNRLGARAKRTMIVEDAMSGVQAGVRGGFGLVLGVARDGDAEKLRRNGASLVVRDLSQISLPEIERWFALRASDAKGDAVQARCP